MVIGGAECRKKLLPLLPVSRQCFVRLQHSLLTRPFSFLFSSATLRARAGFVFQHDNSPPAADPSTPQAARPARACFRRTSVVMQFDSQSTHQIPNWKVA